MKPSEVAKIRGDVECHLYGNEVLIHYVCPKLYLLSNNDDFHGAICKDMSKYCDRYSYSYFIYNTSDSYWDIEFVEQHIQNLHRIEENIGCLE